MSEYQFQQCVCLDDFRQVAKDTMAVAAFKYFDQGSEDQVTLKRNRKDFHRLMIIPRILISSQHTDLTTSLFGRKLSVPFGFAPWAMQALAHPDGQLITSKVAGESNIVMTLSCLTNKPLASVAQANADRMRLLQLYVSQDWNLTLGMIKLAQKHGFTGLVITVDAQVLGNRREQNQHTIDYSKLDFPLLQEAQQVSTGKKGEKTDRVKFLANRQKALTWQTIDRIRKVTSLKIILKGIMHPADAATAVNHCDAVWVSNHGGRQLDGVSSTIAILPSIVTAVSRRVPILIDGGVRTGNDVYKCLALGADYVFIGRPVAYSLVFGHRGVSKLVAIVKEQLRKALILVGCDSVKEIDPKSVVPQPTL